MPVEEGSSPVLIPTNLYNPPSVPSPADLPLVPIAAPRDPPLPSSLNDSDPNAISPSSSHPNDASSVSPPLPTPNQTPSDQQPLPTRSKVGIMVLILKYALTDVSVPEPVEPTCFTHSVKHQSGGPPRALSLMLLKNVAPGLLLSILPK